jgi:hypothetical protein
LNIHPVRIVVVVVVVVAGEAPVLLDISSKPQSFLPRGLVLVVLVEVDGEVLVETFEECESRSARRARAAGVEDDNDDDDEDDDEPLLLPFKSPRLLLLLLIL